MRVPRSRLVHAAAIVLVIAVGLASRRYSEFVPEVLGKYPGDALWALMVFLGLGFLKPRWSSASIAGVALAISFMVELGQMYQAPWINAIRETTLGHLVLGTTFNAFDLVAYSIGVLAGYLLEIAFGHRAVGSRDSVAR